MVSATIPLCHILWAFFITMKGYKLYCNASAYTLMSSYTLTSSSKTRKLHIWFYYTILYTRAYVPSPYINFESNRITSICTSLFQTLIRSLYNCIMYNRIFNLYSYKRASPFRLCIITETFWRMLFNRAQSRTCGLVDETTFMSLQLYCNGLPIDAS